MLTVCECTSVSLINLDLEIVFRVLLDIRGYRGQFTKNYSFSVWYVSVVTTWEFLAISSFVSMYSI